MIDGIRAASQRAKVLLASPIFPLLVLVFSIQGGSSMIWSMLSLYVSSMGGSTATAGTIVAGFGFARVLANLPAGFASEKFGRRRMMLFGCSILGAACFLITATTGIPALFGFIVLMGFGSSMYITSALTTAVDLGSPERRVKDMVAYQSANLLGLTIGPGIGGMLAAAFGYHAIFLAQGFIAIAGILVLSLMPWSAVKPKKSDDAATPAKRGFSWITVPMICAGLMTFAGFYSRFTAGWVMLPLVAQAQFAMSLDTIGLVLTASSIGNLLCLTFTARAATWIGRTNLVLVGGALIVLSTLGLALGTVPAYVWAASFGFGVGAGISVPTLAAIIADAAPADRRGPTMALLRSAQDLALILGPPLTGLITDHLGYGFTGGLLSCALLMLLALILFRFLLERGQPGAVLSSPSTSTLSPAVPHEEQSKP